jgi:hypothetical protein
MSRAVAWVFGDDAVRVKCHFWVPVRPPACILPSAERIGSRNINADLPCGVTDLIFTGNHRFILSPFLRILPGLATDYL